MKLRNVFTYLRIIPFLRIASSLFHYESFHFGYIVWINFVGVLAQETQTHFAHIIQAVTGCHRLRKVFLLSKKIESIMR